MSKLKCVRKACRINDRIFDEIVKGLGAGQFKTEKDIERYILRRFRQEKVGFAYRPIVANNISVIHAKPRNRKLKRGFLLMDFACRCESWCSDMTRTIFLGKANSEEKKLYDLVLNCQKKCVGLVKDGVECFEVDILSRRLLGSQRGTYKHWVGHGIGKKVHDKPGFGIFTTDVLKKGDIIAIEPGIYIKDKKEEFGIRVEDTIVVTGNGSEVLSKAPTNFIEILAFGK